MNLIKAILRGILQGLLVLLLSLNSFTDAFASDFEVETLLDQFGCQSVCQTPGFSCIDYLPELSLDDERTVVWPERLGVCVAEGE